MEESLRTAMEGYYCPSAGHTRHRWRSFYHRKGLESAEPPTLRRRNSSTVLPVLGINLALLIFCVILVISTTPVHARPDPELLQKQFLARSLLLSDSPQISDCQINCTGIRPRRVCGTDGHTYQSKCHVKRARKCGGRDVQVRASGSCQKAKSGPAAGTKCLLEREVALAHLKEKTASEVYVPECLEDGSFANVQCHNTTGYCWCVRPDGKPFTGYTVKGRSRINCSKLTFQPPTSSERKQEPIVPSTHISRKNRASKQKRRGTTRSKEKCKRAHRSTFNANLITLFTKEYTRIPKPSPPQFPGAPKDLPIVSESDALLDTEERRVIEWKFSELDTDKDNTLRRKEIRALRDMVKKVVRPKACARDFIKYCDLDKNGKIARQEWSVCLGVDLNKSARKGSRKVKGPKKVGGQGGSRRKNGDKIAPPRSRGPGTDPAESDLGGIDNGGPAPSVPRGIGLRPSPDATMVNTETPTDVLGTRDCMTERLKAEDFDRSDPEGSIFIPECVPPEEGGTADGGGVLYRKAQCHKATGYCWCVEQDSGVPIPGTSTHNVMPDCDNINIKVFKGCQYPQKKLFLTELLDQIATEMVEYANNDTSNRRMFEPDPDHTIEERAARWKLMVLDTNNNQILERKELKNFKNNIERTGLLRKCGRNFVKYCDEDGDNRITVNEWIECLGLNEQPQQSNLPVNPKRQGPNPFKLILRGS